MNVKQNSRNLRFIPTPQQGSNWIAIVINIHRYLDLLGKRYKKSARKGTEPLTTAHGLCNRVTAEINRSNTIIIFHLLIAQ